MPGKHKGRREFGNFILGKLRGYTKPLDTDMRVTFTGSPLENFSHLSRMHVYSHHRRLLLGDVTSHQDASSSRIFPSEATSFRYSERGDVRVGRVII